MSRCQVSGVRCQAWKIIVLLIYFISTLALSVGTSFFNSPDENANFVFASKFASDQILLMYEPLNYELGGIVHPRSAIALVGYVAPISFLGLPVFAGTIGSLFGDKSMLLVTPILAVLAILAWRSLMFKFTKDERLADLSALFLMIHPAFWYYSARVMMHNVGFVTFLILGAWFVFVGLQFNGKSLKGDLLNWLGAGLMFGFALCFRTSEIIWVAIVAVALLIIYRKFVDWKKISSFLLTLSLVLVGLGALNYATYGSSFSTGYTIGGEDGANVSELESDDESVDEKAIDKIVERFPFANYLFPFGIHEKNIYNNFIDYGYRLYPWMTVLAVIGLLSVARDKKWREYIWITLSLSAWLIIVYGSWKFNDNPDASVITLGNSYVRYWLPIFVLLSAFCAVAVDRLSKLTNKKWQSWMLSVIVGSSVLSSGYLVVFGEDGFVKSRQSLAEIQEKHDFIIENTTDTSIIVVDMADKYLWPEKRVVTPLRSEKTYAAIPIMLELGDVYYFGITFPQIDLDYLNNSKLKDLGARIEEVGTIRDETLYQINND